MLRKLTIAAALAAGTALTMSAASAQSVTTNEVVYSYPSGYTYTTTTQTPVVVTPAPATRVVTPAPVTRYVPKTVYVPQRVVNDPYVPAGTAYVVPRTQVVVRPADCGLFHYWNGAACIDARVTPPVLVTQD